MSLRFDRTLSQYMQVGDVTTFKWMHGAEDPTAFKWSVSFWFKAVDYSGQHTIVDTVAGASANVGMGIAILANRAVAMGINRGVGSVPVITAASSAGAVPDDGQWHNIVVSYDQSLVANNCAFYVDGSLVANATKTVNMPSTANQFQALTFGMDYLGGNLANAYVEDLRFYKDVILSVDEVKVIAKDRGHDSIIKGLWARYKFADGYDGEPAGKDVLLLHCDGSDGANDFVDSAYGNKAVTAYVNATMIQGINKFGLSSAKFDGSSYLSIPDSTDWDFGTGDFTIDFWVRFTSINRDQVFLSQFDTDMNHRWVIFAYSTNKLGLLFTNGSMTGYYYMTNAWSGLATGIWYHLAFERTTTSAKIFIDGVSQILTEDTAFGSNNVGVLSAPLYIGKQNFVANEAWVTGYLDEIRITKGAARWTNNFTPPLQPYFTEIAETSGRGLNTFVSSASAPRFRSGELSMKRRYRR